MSQPDSVNPDPMAEAAFPPSGGGPGPRPTEQKQRLNVYTMMLVISVIALSIAITLLHLELERWYMEGPFPSGQTDWWPPWKNIPSATFLDVDQSFDHSRMG